MQDVTNVLYECLGRVTHIQNELERQQRLSSSFPVAKPAQPQPDLGVTTSTPTVDDMMARLDKISSLNEIG